MHEDSDGGLRRLPDLAMPVKTENRALYPADWDAISRAAKERAGWKCQHRGCNARQYAVGYWRGDVWCELGHVGWELPGAYKHARQIAAEQQWDLTGDEPRPAEKVIVIVLTTMHLDHNPANCAPENLRPACQRHHLAYDAAHHQQTAYATRMAGRNNMELPL